jgi:hypothetical protein
MMEKLSSPKPLWPASTDDPIEVAACHAGGCGSWNGSGVTIRRGMEKVSDSYSKYSLVHISETIFAASTSCALDVSASTPKASCSIGVERPRPHSTRPPLSTSTVATFSAMRAGWVKLNGASVTPKPSLMFLVSWLSAPWTASGVGQCERPSRKWCSTSHTVLNPSSSPRTICSSASL